MSSNAAKISPEDRGKITLPPPPELKRDGTLLQLYPLTERYYADIALYKKELTVYVDEELDAYDHPGSLRHYRMMIRCMPFKNDLNLIMCAARHMLMLSTYSFSYEEREGIDPSLERGFWDVKYVIARDQMRADDDTHVVTDIYVPYLQRRRIWIELFNAMGYNVKWGSSVLNVRKKK